MIYSGAAGAAAADMLAIRCEHSSREAPQHHFREAEAPFSGRHYFRGGTRNRNLCALKKVTQVHDVAFS